MTATKKKTGNAPEKNKKVIIIAVSVLLAAVLLAGGILIAVSEIRQARACISYKGLTMDEGVTSFLAASFKYDYLVYLKQEAGVYEALDTPEFWGKYTIGNNTYGEALEQECELYLKQVAVGAYLFDRYSRMTSSDKAELKKACSDVLEYHAAGSESVFNRMAEPMGFDYSDFVKGSELLYKAKRAQTSVYGEDGSALASGDYTDQCDRFYAYYSHVDLLMIRTEDDFATDTEGNRVQGEDGNDEKYQLSDSQRLERLAEVEQVRQLIAAVGGGGESYMSHGAFRQWISKYNYDPENALSGYYFLRGTEYTSEFAEGLPEVVSKALSMEEGSFAEVELEDGVYVFLYRYEPQPGAYYSSSYSRFFGDFFAKCADYLYIDSLNTLCAEVVTGERYSLIDPIAIPYNKDLYPNV